MKKAFHIPQRRVSDAAGLVFRPDSPWLAPLAGYSDLPFRLLCRDLGAAVCETEMISAKGLLYRSPASGDLFLSDEADFPLVVQLFGGDPNSMAGALSFLRQLGYDAFDCNMGCPVRKVMRQNAGSALMARPDLALAIAAAMLKAASLPDLSERPARLGFKLRLDPGRKAGFAADFGRRLEDLGASWICLHPRSASEGFGGVAHWDEIARLVEATNIPVIASGDIFSAEAAKDCLRQTGAAGVMYGRGALANPFVFALHKTALAGETGPELDRSGLKAMITRHIELAKKFGGGDRAFRKMRSVIPRYTRQFRGVNELRQKLCQAGDWDALARALDNFGEWEEK